MNRIFSRILSFILSLALCLPLLASSVSAAESTVTFGGKTYRGEADYLPYFYRTSSSGATLTDCLESVSGTATLPDRIGSFALTAIGAGAFSDCTDLVSVYVPKSVTSIAEDAFSGLENFTILGASGSYAETFAAEAGIDFELPFLLGDSNRDGVCDAKDLVHLAKVLAAWNQDYSQKASDVNSDYEITARDLTALAKEMADWADPTLFILGDEAAASAQYTDDYYPRSGYGDALGTFLSSHKVQTLADSGLSAKSALKREEYLELFNELEAGDWVLINFGANDSLSLAESYSPAAGDHTTEGSFAYCLYEYYLRPILARGATPILATPVPTRPMDGVTFTPACLHEDYADAMRTLAADTGTALIDLTELSRELYLMLGAQTNAYLNAWQTRDADSLYSNFLSLFGAEQIAQRLCAALTAVSGEFVSSGAQASYATAETYLSAFSATATDSVFIYSDGTRETTDATLITADSYRVPKGAYLSYVSLAEGVREIGSGAFAGQYEMELLYSLPSTLQIIGDGAFHSCADLWIDILPENLTAIGRAAFYGCESLTLCELGESVTSLGEYAFYGCDSIPGIAFGARLASIPARAFSGCDSLTAVELNAHTEEIGRCAFEGCPALFEVILSDNLTTIGQHAFKGSAVTELTLPKTLETLESESLAGCAELCILRYPCLATDWTAIERGTDWYKDTLLSVIHCEDGDVTVEGEILVDYHAYYSDFASALADANAFTAEHADLTRHQKGDAAAAILLQNGELTLKLFANVNLFEVTALQGTFTLDLMGCAVVFGTAGTHFELAADADISVTDSVGGGRVYKHIDSSSAQYLYNLPSTGTALSITGGTHTCENSLGSAITVRGMGTSGSSFSMSGGALSATAAESGNAKAVQAPETTLITGGTLASKSYTGNSYTLSGIGTFIITGGTFDSYTTGGNSIALFAGSGESATAVEIYDGSFTTHASRKSGKHVAFSTAPGASATIYGGSFTVDSKKTGDDGACGIATSGPSLIIYDAYVQGNSAGLQAHGVNTTIYGGTYIGADHGGAYFGHASEIGTICVFGGDFLFILPDWQISTSGTGSAYFSGGGKIYVDSANFSGRQVAISNVGTTSEETTLYISRTTAPSWRIDSFHTVYFGEGMANAQITGDGTYDLTLYAATAFTESYVRALGA